MASRQAWRKRPHAAQQAEARDSARDEDPLDKECSVCYANTAVDDRKHFPCSSHWVCKVCYPRVTSCPMCRVGKDGSTQDARVERDREPVLMVVQWESMQDGSIQPRTRRPRVVTFNAGGGQGGPMTATNITVHAPGGLPQALRDILPGILSRSLVQRDRRAQDRAEAEVVRIRSILSSFGDPDHA